MPERLKQIPDEIWNFLIKVLPFSLAALAISISVQVKNKTASVISAILSIVIGVSCAYITGTFITNHFSTSTAPIIIGVVTIAGEKIAYWLIYKFNFDLIGEALVKSIVKRFKK